MQHRISELREEIQWAQNQLDATHYEGLTWERLVMNKQAVAGGRWGWGWGWVVVGGGC